MVSDSDYELNDDSDRVDGGGLMVMVVLEVIA